MAGDRPSSIQMIAHLIGAPIVVRPLVRFLYRCPRPRRPFAREGGYLLASNHRSFLDPVLIACFMDRPVSFFARASLWRIPIIRQMLDLFGGLPVDRSEPQAAVLQRTVRWLRAGRNVLLFPEGTRTRDGRLGPLRPGAALFARRGGVALLPVYVHATERAWPRGRLLPRLGVRLGIAFGTPIARLAGLDDRAGDSELNARLERWLRGREQLYVGKEQR